MMNYTMAEIFESIASAAIYGVIFSFSAIFIKVIFSQLAIICRLAREMFFYRGSLRQIDTLERLKQSCNLSYGRSFVSSNNTSVIGDCKGIFGFAKKYVAKFYQSIAIFFAVLFYFVGVILTSYYSLDGDIRLYFIAVSSLATYIFSRFFGIIFKYLAKFLVFVYKLLIITVRILTYPLRKTVLLITRFFRKIMEKIIQFIPDTDSHILDKSIK